MCEEDRLRKVLEDAVANIALESCSVIRVCHTVAEAMRQEKFGSGYYVEIAGHRNTPANSLMFSTKEMSNFWISISIDKYNLELILPEEYDQILNGLKLSVDDSGSWSVTVSV